MFNHHTARILHTYIITVRVYIWGGGVSTDPLSNSQSKISIVAFFFFFKYEHLFPNTILKSDCLKTHLRSKLKGNSFLTKEWMIRKKCDQQYHIKSFYSHSLHSSGPEESLNITMSVRPKLTRRRVTEETQETVQSRKVLHFNQKRCYTSLKENVDSKSLFFPHCHLFQLFMQSFISWTEISCCEYAHLGFSYNNRAV